MEGYYGTAFKVTRGMMQGDPLSPLHFQRGGGCGGAALVYSDGGERGRAGRTRTRGHTSKCPLLLGQWHGHIVGPVMTTGDY